MFLTYRN